MESNDKRFMPCSLWHMVVGYYVSPMRVTPKMYDASVKTGRASKILLAQMFAVVVASRAINNMMERPTDAGLRKEVL